LFRLRQYLSGERKNGKKTAQTEKIREEARAKIRA
jgi:hypothetical protein